LIEARWAADAAVHPEDPPMAMVEMNWRPTDRQLRQFGWFSLIGFPLVGWALAGFRAPAAWSTTLTTVLAVLAALGLAFAVVGTVRPGWLTYPFVGLSLIAFPIGFVVSYLLLIVLYYGIFTPVGLFFRLIGRDALERRFDRSASTYWTEKKMPTDIRRYFRQY
jgi:hypothetical protein